MTLNEDLTAKIEKWKNIEIELNIEDLREKLETLRQKIREMGKRETEET